MTSGRLAGVVLLLVLGPSAKMPFLRPERWLCGALRSPNASDGQRWQGERGRAFE